MGHHHSEEPKIEPKLNVSSPEEVHPFLSKNDLALLSLATPFLSPNGQKIINFFINFNHQGQIQLPDFSGIFNQFSNSDNGKLLQEFLPLIFNLTSKMDQVNLDPGLLTSLLGLLNNNHKPNTQDNPN